MPNIQSTINQLIGFVGNIGDQYQNAAESDSITPSTTKIGNQRKLYKNSTAATNYKAIMKNIANKISDRNQQKKLHKAFMNIVRPSGPTNKGI